MRSDNPLVSICIPTYRQTFLLKQNLDSICAQTHQMIEVIVSDDSPDDAVKELAETYRQRLPLRYVQNRPSLGSPANWNAVLKSAKGEFVLLLHHDDQFAKPDSLARLLQPLVDDPALSFSFARNESIDSITGGKPLSPGYFNRYYNDPSLLITVNTVGAPSNVLLRRDVVAAYDERFKWIVDIELYFRLFKAGKKYAYTDEHLVKTGRHEGQVTNECINDSAILLFENLTFAAEKIVAPKSITVFDFYWRLLRNNNVKSIADLEAVGINVKTLPRFVHRIVSMQTKIPSGFLQKGIFSKPLMALTYLLA